MGMCPVLRQASSRHMTDPSASAVGAVSSLGLDSCCAVSSEALSESFWLLQQNNFNCIERLCTIVALMG